MGEYIKINNQSVKIGVCETLLITRAEAEALAADPKCTRDGEGNCPPADYAQPKGWIYRVAFPDESPDSIGARDDRPLPLGNVLLPDGSRAISLDGMRYKMAGGTPVFYSVFTVRHANGQTEPVSLDAESCDRIRTTVARWAVDQIVPNPLAESTPAAPAANPPSDPPQIPMPAARLTWQAVYDADSETYFVTDGQRGFSTEKGQDGSAHWLARILNQHEER